VNGKPMLAAGRAGASPATADDAGVTYPANDMIITGGCPMASGKNVILWRTNINSLGQPSAAPTQTVLVVTGTWEWWRHCLAWAKRCATCIDTEEPRPREGPGGSAGPATQFAES